MKLSFVLFLIVSIGLMINSQADYVYDRTTNFCEWLKQNHGYGCDKPVERWIWKKYHRLVNGERICNDLCVRINRSGGKCTPLKNGVLDRSTWCSPGQYCQCF